MTLECRCNEKGIGRRDTTCGDCPFDYVKISDWQNLVEAAKDMMEQDAVKRATQLTNPFMADAADRLSAALRRVGA